MLCCSVTTLALRNDIFSLIIVSYSFVYELILITGARPGQWKRRYMCDIFFHWMRPCLFDRIKAFPLWVRRHISLDNSTKNSLTWLYRVRNPTWVSVITMIYRIMETLCRPLKKFPWYKQNFIKWYLYEWRFNQVVFCAVNMNNQAAIRIQITFYERPGDVIKTNTFNRNYQYQLPNGIPLLVRL